MMIGTKQTLSLTLLCALGVSGSGLAEPGDRERRAEWYRATVVNLHIDNHDRPVGDGLSPDELADWIRDLPVGVVQVSAFGARGATTYPTALPIPTNSPDWDTLSAWREATRLTGHRFGIYLNTRGLHLHRDHPDWIQVDAEGRGRAAGGGYDVCPRPRDDAGGPLEQVFLPLLRELTLRYAPDAFWVDGDHARTPVCYCPGCRQAWRRWSGTDAPPPTGAEDPRWQDWCRLEQERMDAYRRRMADLVHELRPQCLYSSNHSWRITPRDPRDAPPWIDTLTADLSQPDSLERTRVSAMALAPEWRVPHDIMHLVNGLGFSERRVLQNGALTLSAGSCWYLWTLGTSIASPETRDLVRRCAEFAQARSEPAPMERSANRVAVLQSENDWMRAREAGDPDLDPGDAAVALALALQDLGFGVDLVNESLLLQQRTAYDAVFVVALHDPGPGLSQWLPEFIRTGGRLACIGPPFLGSDPDRRARWESWTGLTPIETSDPLPVRRTLPPLPALLIQPALAYPAEFGHPGWQAAGEAPFLVNRRLGRGQLWLLNTTVKPCPRGQARLVPALCEAMGLVPRARVFCPDERQVVVSWRRRDRDAILHLTDLTSRIDGRRIVPAESNGIDAETPVDRVVVQVQGFTAPDAVRVLPGGEELEWRMEGPTLCVELPRLDVHACLVLSGSLAGPEPVWKPETRSPESRPLVEGFEDGTIGSVPVLGHVRTDGSTSIGVAGHGAGGSRQCLLFQDHPDAAAPFFPYYSLDPRPLHGGVGTLELDLRLDPGAEVRVELRTRENSRLYPVGPCIDFLGTGEVRIEGVDARPGHLPSGQWWHMTLTQAPRRAGFFDLELVAEDGTALAWRDLPVRDPRFGECGWLGVIGTGREPAAFALDNLRIRSTTE